MDMLKGVQEVIPWLTTLSMLPKTIVSALILGAAGFVLALIWAPVPETAVNKILSDCYRRALFTRMHAQTSQEAMFTSIGECRVVVQKEIPSIRRKDLQGIAVELLATIEGIEGRNPIKNEDDVAAVNKLKLAALHYFRALAMEVDSSYPLPENGKLAEASYFTEAEASAPPSITDLRNQVAINSATGQLAFP